MIGANQQLKIYQATAGERDAEGRKALTYNLSDTVVGNLFERSSRELVDGQWVVIGTYQALLPAGVAVTHKDIIADEDDVRYRIDTVAARRGPDGEVHHISCLLTRTEG